VAINSKVPTAIVTASFDQARADFEAAGRELLPEVTEADLTEHRRQEAWTAWKYTMWDRGSKLPPQLPEGRSRCFSGEAIDIAGMGLHVIAAHLGG
jgi:hypothetical protein